MSFARKSENKYCKKLTDTAKTVSKKVVQKTAEATGDLNGNKIADKITSVGKTKSKEDETNKRQEFNTTRKKTTNYWCL